VAADSEKPRLLIFIVAYHAEATIESVLRRIPHALADDYSVEVLVIDDGSRDRTFERSLEAKLEGVVPFPLRVLFNPVNQGYGGNQKLGYHYAIENGFDHVALIHGDGQYAPECMSDLIAPLREGADAVLGSRMLGKGTALRGGMPLYKYVGNKILTRLQNLLLGTRLSEFHSGYRVYSVKALKRLPFHLNTNDFHFDTEIIIQFVRAGLTIVEIPIPTHYGDEVCRVDGFQYAFNVMKATLKARVQEMSLFYDRRFDCKRFSGDDVRYRLKLDCPSSHTITIEKLPRGSRVVDLGCLDDRLATLFRERLGAQVIAVPRERLESDFRFDDLSRRDIEGEPLPVVFDRGDYILLLDVIEHLSCPEEFVDRLRHALRLMPDATLLVSTANVAFFTARIMLAIGEFNYGKRGILDLSHRRLFTFGSFRRLFEQAGFSVVEEMGIPAPFSLALGDNVFSRFLSRLNSFFIRLSRCLFSYQIYFVVKPLPSLEYLLSFAVEQSSAREQEVLSSRSNQKASESEV